MSARLSIDGRACAVRAGMDLLSACLGEGIDVPYFCWHGALGSAGACRLCAVRVHDGPNDETGRIVMSCMTQAKDGQRVRTDDPEAAALRARVIEWLMINHPHDCAVCEEAGSCHLQDMTVATGHRVRRHRFDKRTHHNQDLGPLLTHEMNRCIACYRCTRFYRDYAGGRDLDVFGAHDRVYFGRAQDGPLESPFAGNLAEVCPTGVFNDKAWSADYARKWDMRSSPSVCGHCSVGCNLFLAERGGRLRRVQNRYHGALNGYFLCDRGRFGPLSANSETRLRAPRIGGAAASEAAAVAAARTAIAEGAIGIGSPRASLEANFALRRLVGAERFFAGLSDAEARLTQRMAEILRAGPAHIASLADIEAADAALVLGEDLTGAAPRLALAVRQMTRGAAKALAARKGVPAFLDEAVRVAGEGRLSPLILAGPTREALSDVARRVASLDPPGVAAFGFAVAAALGGGETADEVAGETATALAAAERPLVIAGASLGLIDIVEAAAAIAAALGPRARIVLVPAEANSLGLALLGGAGLESAADLLERDGALAVVALEADLFARAPRATTERLFAAAGTVVALDAVETETTERADVVLPTAALSETPGTFVNFEGRAQRAFAAVRPEPGAPPAWRRLADLGAGDWARFDDLIALAAAERADLAGIAEIAPGADYRTPAGAVTRTPWPFSGRTADDRAGRVPEGEPPPHPDSPLNWGMEGARGADVPPPLLTGYEGAGLHSANAVTRFLEEIGGPLRGGDPGVHLITPGHGPQGADPGAIEDKGERGGDGLWLVPLHDPFTGDETSRASAPLAARAPGPRLVLHPDDAAALGLAAGDLARAEGNPGVAPVSLDPGLPRGVAAISPGATLPRGPARRGRIEAAR